MSEFYLDKYLEIIDSTFGDWREIKESYKKVLIKNPKIEKLAKSGYLAVNGKDENLSEVVGALYCFLKGIILVDDILDLDPRGEHKKIGEGKAANQAQAFLAAGYKIIFECGCNDFQKINISTLFSDMLLHTAYGQKLDIEIPSTEEAYWIMVRAKSSPFYCSLFQAGAIAGGGTVECINEIKGFGDIYGEMIQIHDDLMDSFEIPAGPDWVQGRVPLPILYAELVDHPERSRFLELRKEIDIGNNLQEAQKILLSCGAVGYCIEKLLDRYKDAKKILDSSERLIPSALEGILAEIMVAPQNLIDKVGTY